MKSSSGFKLALFISWLVFITDSNNVLSTQLYKKFSSNIHYSFYYEKTRIMK